VLRSRYRRLEPPVQMLGLGEALRVGIEAGVPAGEIAGVQGGGFERDRRIGRVRIALSSRWRSCRRGRGKRTFTRAPTAR
jgi:hypothetical protein